MCLWVTWLHLQSYICILLLCPISETGFVSWINFVACKLRALKETLDFIGGCNRRKRSERPDYYKVWAFRGAGCGNCCILGWNALWSGICLQIFLSNLCPDCEGRELLLVVKDVVHDEEHLKCCSLINNERQTFSQVDKLTVRTRTPLQRAETFISCRPYSFLNTKTGLSYRNSLCVFNHFIFWNMSLIFKTLWILSYWSPFQNI